MIRPATDADLPRVAEILSEDRPEPTTVESLREMTQRFPENGVLVRLVDEDAKGEIRCVGSSVRWPHEPADRRKIVVRTVRDARRQGLGSAMYEALVSHGGTDLRTETLDNDSVSLQFAERRGYVTYRHVFESSLDLESADLDQLWQAIERAERNGVRFFSFGETAMDEEATRKLWSVNSISNLDQPGLDEPKAPFEDWCAMVTKADWFAPESQLLAAVGDEWVGLGAVGTFSPGRFYNLYTGVLKPYRGQGIASALKALGIRYAQSRGGQSIRTNNDSQNVPMLEINRCFGYQPLPGWYSLQKEGNLAN